MRRRFALGLLGFGSSAFAVAALAWDLFPCLSVFVSLSPLVLPVMIAIALPLWYFAARDSRSEGSVTESSNSDPDQTRGGVGGGLSGESSGEASGDSPGEGSSFGSSV